MKIATFNINNVNRRLPNLLRWLKQARRDVVCLQELKATDQDFPAAAFEKAGYQAIWRGQKTHEEVLPAWTGRPCCGSEFAIHFHIRSAEQLDATGEAVHPFIR